MLVLIWVQTVCKKILSGILSEYQTACIQIRTDVPCRSWPRSKLFAKNSIRNIEYQTAWIQIRMDVPCRSWPRSKLFAKNSFRNIIRVSNSLDPDQDRCSMLVLMWVQTVCKKILLGILSEYQTACGSTFWPWSVSKLFAIFFIWNVTRVSNSFDPDQDRCYISALIWVQTVCKKFYQEHWVSNSLDPDQDRCSMSVLT